MRINDDQLAKFGRLIAANTSKIYVTAIKNPRNYSVRRLLKFLKLINYRFYKASELTFLILFLNHHFSSSGCRKINQRSASFFCTYRFDGVRTNVS